MKSGRNPLVRTCQHWHYSLYFLARPKQFYFVFSARGEHRKGIRIILILCTSVQVFFSSFDSIIIHKADLKLKLCYFSEASF